MRLFTFAALAAGNRAIAQTLLELRALQNVRNVNLSRAIYLSVSPREFDLIREASLSMLVLTFTISLCFTISWAIVCPFSGKIGSIQTVIPLPAQVQICRVAAATLDFNAVRSDLRTLFVTSQKQWPADYGVTFISILFSKSLLNSRSAPSTQRKKKTDLCSLLHSLGLALFWKLSNK